MYNCHGLVDGICLDIFKSGTMYVLIIAYYEENNSCDEIRINDIYGVLCFQNFNKYIGKPVLAFFDICSLPSSDNDFSYSSYYYLRSLRLKDSCDYEGYFHG